MDLENDKSDFKSVGNIKERNGIEGKCEKFYMRDDSRCHYDNEMMKNDHILAMFILFYYRKSVKKIIRAFVLSTFSRM